MEWEAQIGFAPGFELVRTRLPRILPVINDGQVTTNATTTAVTTPNVESNDQTTPSSTTSYPVSENSATTPLPVSESPLSEWTKVLLYSGIPAFVLACLVVFLVVSLRRRRAKASDKTQFIRYPDEGSADRSPSPKVKRPTEEYQPKDPAFQGKEFDRSLLKIEKELGAGQFGIVYKAFAFGISGLKEYVSVAAKSLRVNATSAMKEDFLNEIRLMIDLGLHPNILPILGCCTTEEPYYLITEYMKYGDLLHFLWKCREDKYRQQDNTFDLTSANQLQIARQIARGMEYIFKARYYHGDLAARNVLVGEGLEVKISDFGLADDIYQSGYKRLAPDKKRPVKWVSLETNTIGQCTIQSDVWSFGIVLYEIYTLGGIPYSGMDGREVVHRTQEGYRMEKPDHCPDQIYEVMRACWHANPAERPTFTTIFKRLDEMLAIDSDYLTAEDDLCKAARSTAPSYGELVRRSSAEDVNPADASNEKEADRQSEEVDIVMATASMETCMGHGIHGPPLAEEECSFEIKRDDEILIASWGIRLTLKKWDRRLQL
ncbi:fibroblast growth factor receptor 2-like [Diadema antillarum]|uniref:fibroblast growth factor receptor 2-like n=1 Tax=Diadema antillarum TaxID=105358 RepID=UPI003A890727